jgi:hypothetical protein
MKDNILTGAPDARQKVKFRLFGKRRSDRAKLMLIINSVAAFLMVLIGYLIG